MNVVFPPGSLMTTSGATRSLFRFLPPRKYLDLNVALVAYFTAQTVLCYGVCWLFVPGFSGVLGNAWWSG